jgi:hypothetical protein
MDSEKVIKSLRPWKESIVSLPRCLATNLQTQVHGMVV